MTISAMSPPPLDVNFADRFEIVPKLYNSRASPLLTRLARESKLQPSASRRLHRRCERIINANGHPTSGDDVALFIDWENFKISLAAGNRTPNVSALKEEVSNHGRVVVAKAFADWVTRSPELKGASQFINDPPALYAAGIEPVYVPTRLPLGSPSSMNARTTRVKNSVDVKMTADCIECAHSYPNIGTYVLVSGDSDFIHVINSLRAIGKRVIIIGVSWSTSRRLADQVDGLILYDFDVDPEVQPEPAPAPVSRSSRSGTTNRQQISDVMRTIEDIVRSERQAGRTPLLTSLKQRIMRRIPGFDEKKLGFSGFKKLMLHTAEEGTIRLVTVGLVDWVIMADEPTPEEALPDSRVGGGAIESVAAEEEVIPSADRQANDEAETEFVAESETQPSATEDESAESEPIAPDVAPDEDLQPALATASAPADDLTLSVDNASSQTDSVLNETPQESEAFSDAAESEAKSETGSEIEAEAEPPALSPELERVLEETLSQLELPKGPGDGLDGRRIADLVIMADSLEHQEGISHVAFNFLLAEICGALQQGLEAEHPEITGRWGGRIYSRTYVTRLLRGLGDKDVFVRDWHQEKSEETGRSRRFRTFNLNRTHPLVKEAVVSQWGPEADTVPSGPDSSPAEGSSDEGNNISESAMPEMVVAASAAVTTSTEVGGPSVNGHDTVTPEVVTPETVSAETPEASETPRKKPRRAPVRRKRESAAKPVPAAES